MVQNNEYSIGKWKEEFIDIISRMVKKGKC
jgi:hypothetical protein